MDKMGKMEYYWRLADGAGLNPLVFLIGIALYFMLRWGFSLDKWKAIAFVFAVNLLGVMRITKDRLENWDDILYLAIGQSVIAFGIYSTLEVMKIIDLLDALKEAVLRKIKKLFGGSDATPPADPA